MDHVSIGVFARLWRWLRDFAAMPGNVRKLAETAEFQSDVRPACTSCGKGRVGNLIYRRINGFPETQGTCDHCEAVWQVSEDGRTLDHIVKPGRH
ncbi:MAG: hypothetical protein J0H10_15925 [Alphaproteobacteria bacterium]|nr:hypothetical protein [Alphaproteobacteria bacterium]